MGLSKGGFPSLPWGSPSLLLKHDPQANTCIIQGGLVVYAYDFTPFYTGVLSLFLCRCDTCLPLSRFRY